MKQFLRSRPLLDSYDPKIHVAGAMLTFEMTRLQEDFNARQEAQRSAAHAAATRPLSRTGTPRRHLPQTVRGPGSVQEHCRPLVCLMAALAIAFIVSASHLLFPSANMITLRKSWVYTNPEISRQWADAGLDTAAAIIAMLHSVSRTSSNSTHLSHLQRIFRSGSSLTMTKENLFGALREYVLPVM